MEDIHEIHKVFLGDVYEFAGKLRNVNLSKGGFTFPTVIGLDAAVNELEKVLRRFTPCRGPEKNVIDALGTVHGLFEFIHPYREGNGRTGRLLAIAMAYQAGFPGLDFEFINASVGDREAYYQAVRAAAANKYGPMREIMRIALQSALGNVPRR